MAEIDHWHPVLPSRALRRKPVGVRTAGRNLVVFRTASGQIGALDDACVHRRMKLSTGCVTGERLRCPYHGWTFTCDGRGESPGSPKMRADATSYAVREAHGAVWLKAADSPAEFPRFEIDGYYPLGVLSHRAAAPLETTLDNFCEVEHTPTTHALFGYQLNRMHEVTTRCDAGDDWVRVVNDGPHKPLPWYWRWSLGIDRNASFTDDWTTYFSPVYTVFDHSLRNSLTGRAARVRWRVYVFLTPTTPEETLVTTIGFVRASYIGPVGGARVIRPLLRRMLDRELALDCGILSNLADKSSSLDGLRLGRFDRALGLNRERIERIYRGSSGEPIRNSTAVAGS
jgi:phenylpropionate dioxygenase-like ring-hydroxylating dioxygenase large terminal subunit